VKGFNQTLSALMGAAAGIWIKTFLYRCRFNTSITFIMTTIKSSIPLGFPWKTQDPFLFCVHHLDVYPAGNVDLGPVASLKGRKIGQDFGPNQEGWRMYHGTKVPGFPAHPHYGFETVTIVTTGVVDHSDSLGAAGRFGNGDVQWMTAGRGVQHSEMFPLLNTEGSNPLELFQIWLNLPGSQKTAAPHFAMLWGDTIPVVNVQDEHGNVAQLRLISGAFDGVKAPDPAPDSWAADPENDVAIWTLRLAPFTRFVVPPAGKGAIVNRSLFFYKGSTIEVDEQQFASSVALELHADRETVIRNGDADASLLLLQGRPIKEPVVQQGPFVASSQEEIRQVISSFHRTQFGGWPWPSFEHVHPRDSKRFALYPDGKKIERPL
jgi:quercetin 2,3-dioxygenase